jgi:N utilization substance protein A
MIRKLFALEVPEIASGAIEIKAVAREAGSRAKIAVMSNQENIDPIGSCVGQRGSRVQTVITELGGEKIDIIEWSDDPVKFIINSLAPAKVLSVKLDKNKKEASAEVKEDQLSLAIGRAGQNVRLSAKLTGWKIDIVKERESKSSRDKSKNEQTQETLKELNKEKNKKEEEKDSEDKKERVVEKKKSNKKKVKDKEDKK